MARRSRVLYSVRLVRLGFGQCWVAEASAAVVAPLMRTCLETKRVLPAQQSMQHATRNMQHAPYDALQHTTCTRSTQHGWFEPTACHTHGLTLRSYRRCAAAVWQSCTVRRSRPNRRAATSVPRSSHPATWRRATCSIHRHATCCPCTHVPNSGERSFRCFTVKISLDHFEHQADCRL